MFLLIYYIWDDEGYLYFFYFLNVLFEVFFECSGEKVEFNLYDVMKNFFFGSCMLLKDWCNWCDGEGGVNWVKFKWFILSCV